MSEPRYGIWAPVGGNFGPLDTEEEPVDASYERSRSLPQPVRFGLSAFVIARPTDAEAQVELQRLAELQKKEEHLKLSVAKGVDPDAVMFKLFAKNPAVGGNGGTAAGLVGSYDTVATRIAAFADAGIDTFMLQFNPFVREMTRFAEEVIPRIRHLQPV